MNKKIKLCLGTLIVLLLVAVGMLIYVFTGHGGWMTQTSYLQSTKEMNKILSGILYNNSVFYEGEDFTLMYDFDNPMYQELLDKYDIASVAGDGSEFEKALALMDEYSDRLYHVSNYDGHVEMNAIALLEYSLDNKKQGINCRNKAQILNEMCLALGIYSRKVWIKPNSIYDDECHVVNEIWDTELNKWVMLDISNNFYWVDEKGTPLSILEIRENIANQVFCTPVAPDDDLKDLNRSLNKNYGNYLYTAKNMVYTQYCAEYGVGECEEYYSLMPDTMLWLVNTEFISEEAVKASPIGN